MNSLVVNVKGSSGYVQGRKVSAHFNSVFGFGTHSTEYTNSQGKATFRNFPACKVEVFVDDKKTTVSVGQNEHKEITVYL